MEPTTTMSDTHAHTPVLSVSYCLVALDSESNTAPVVDLNDERPEERAEGSECESGGSSPLADDVAALALVTGGNDEPDFNYIYGR